MYSDTDLYYPMRRSEYYRRIETKPGNKYEESAFANANNSPSVRMYYELKEKKWKHRNIKLLGDLKTIFVNEGSMDELPVGMEAWFHMQEYNKVCVSIYLFNEMRCNGRYKRIVDKYTTEYPIIVDEECNLRSYLQDKEIPHIFIGEGFTHFSDLRALY